MNEALAAGFDRLLNGWPELAGFAGRRPSSSGLSSLAPGLARDRVQELRSLAEVADDPHDAELLRAQAALFDWLLDGGRWRLNPDVLSEWSALLLRQSLAAGSDRKEAQVLNGWVASIPALLPSGREGREQADAVAKELAIETARGFRAQLLALSPCCSLTAVAAATQAVEVHLGWLESLAPGPVLGALGTEGCAALFEARGLDQRPSEWLEMAKAEVASFAAPLPSPIAADAPDLPASFEHALARLRELLESARTYAPRAGLPGVAMPPLQVMATPEALRPSIPGAAAFTPRPLAKDEVGLIVLTPGDDVDRFSEARLANLAVHEGHPGHGLQAALANTSHRPWRAVDLCPIPGLGSGLFACELMEGWAHFAEERLAEAGFHASDERRRGQHAEARWRAVRARVDLGFNLGELDEEKALDVLTREAGLPAASARAELDDYRLQPTYGLSYLWGKLELRRLRASWRGEESELYRRLLSEGLAPLSMTGRWLSGGGR